MPRSGCHFDCKAEGHTATLLSITEYIESSVISERAAFVIESASRFILIIVS